MTYSGHECAMFSVLSQTENHRKTRMTIQSALFLSYVFLFGLALPLWGGYRDHKETKRLIKQLRDMR